jgi:hypothetical protein
MSGLFQQTVRAKPFPMREHRRVKGASALPCPYFVFQMIVRTLTHWHTEPPRTNKCQMAW